MPSAPQTGWKALVVHEQLEEQEDRELLGPRGRSRINIRINIFQKNTASELPSKVPRTAAHVGGGGGGTPPTLPPPHSPVRADLVGVVDPGHWLRGAAHEEERHAQERGDSQHGHREAGDGLEREPRPLHDDSAHQHPHSHRRQVDGAWWGG